MRDRRLLPLPEESDPLYGSIVHDLPWLLASSETAQRIRGQGGGSFTEISMGIGPSPTGSWTGEADSAK